MFSAYFELGFDHILDLHGYDHILFLVVLCALYAASQWKNILILVTAFTIGHSITLALSARDIISVNATLVEVLIPVTILLTAIYNLFSKPETTKRWRINYLLTLFFGFIHGMGFSNYFKALLGRESDIIGPLFAFNVGVEIGQLCIVGIFMLLNYLVVRLAGAKQKIWTLVFSLIAAVMAVYMILDRLQLI